MSKTLVQFGIQILLLLLVLTAPARAREPAPPPCRLQVTAPVLAQMIKQLLPLNLPTRSRTVSGKLTIEAIDHLRFGQDSIELQGRLAGHDLVVTSSLGGHSFNLRLGQVATPLHCRLRLRYDPARYTLFLTPTFLTASDQDPLKPILDGLASQTYPLDLSKGFGLKPVPGPGGGLRLRPIRIRLTDGLLDLALEPIKLTP